MNQLLISAVSARARAPHRLSRRPAFTLVELLVVIAIIGILVSLLLPAIQAARERARLAMCANHMMQLSLALHKYENGNEVLPSGVTNPTGPIYDVQIGNHISWLAHLLPYVDERNLYDKIDFSAGAYAPVNQVARSATPPVFLCPSAGWLDDMMSSYAGCHNDQEAPIDANNNGVLFLNSRTRLDEVEDGLAYTIFIGEKQTHFADANNSEPDKDLGWLSGTRGTLRNTGTPLNQSVSVASLFTDAWPPDPDPVNWRERLQELELLRQEKLEEQALTGNSEKPETESNSPSESASESDPAAEKQPADEQDQEGEVVAEESEEDNPLRIVPVGPLDPVWLTTPEGTDPNPLLYVGGFGSDHNQGVNFAFGDGSVKLLTPSIDMKLFQRMGARNDGELINASELRD